MLKHSIYCRACSLVSFFGLLCHSTLVCGIFYFIYIAYYLIVICINACVCASVHFRLSRYVHINAYLHGQILWNLQARGNEMGKMFFVHGWTRGAMTWNVNYGVQRVHIQLNAMTTKIIVSKEQAAEDRRGSQSKKKHFVLVTCMFVKVWNIDWTGGIVENMTSLVYFHIHNELSYLRMFC